MPSSADDLRNYFKWLRQQIEGSSAFDEALLSRTVSDAFGLPGSKTLLEALGYPLNGPEVFPQHQVTHAAAIYRVDFRLGSPSSHWVLELKAPDKSIRDDKYVRQLHHYMGADPAPGESPPVAGVLFNGRDADLYFNTEHPKLKAKQYRDLARKSIRSASINDLCEMVAFFEPLQESRLSDLLDYARKQARLFAHEEQQRLRNKEREQSIRQAVVELIKGPDEAVLDAIIQADPKLSVLSPLPTAEEVRRHWPTGPGPGEQPGAESLRVTGKHPSSLVLRNDSQAIGKWRDVAEKVLCFVAKENGDAYKALPTLLPTHVSDDQAKLRRHRRLPEGLYLNTSLSANEVVRLCRGVRKLAGIPSGDVRVLLAEGGEVPL